MLGVPITGVFDNIFGVVFIPVLVTFVDKDDDVPADLEDDFSVALTVDFKPDVKIDLQGVYD